MKDQRELFSDFQFFLEDAKETLQKVRKNVKSREEDEKLRDLAYELDQLQELAQEQYVEYYGPSSKKSSVKSQLIKLGSDNPELREHIRPVLDRIAAIPKSEAYDAATKLEDLMGDAEIHSFNMAENLRKAGEKGLASRAEEVADKVEETRNAVTKLLGDLNRKL